MNPVRQLNFMVISLITVDKDHVPYDRDAINAAITERNIAIEEAKNKAKNGSANSGVGKKGMPSGKAHGRTLAIDM